MPATLERIQSKESYILRVGPEHYKYGDKWNLMAVVEKQGTSALIEAASGKLSDIPSIIEVLKPLGITKVTYIRYKQNGSRVEQEYEI